MDHLQHILGEPITEPEEEAFLIFSQALPSQSLGFIDSKTSPVEITVAGRDLTIHQSRGLLTSDRKEGTTGAVIWKVTPLFAEWVASANFLFGTGLLSSDSIALELGAGVSGIVAVTLGPKVEKYLATDQDYAIRLLKQNIAENAPTPVSINKTKTSKSKKAKLGAEKTVSSIDTLVLDWETDSVAVLPTLLDLSDGVDLVIACDCIYNYALIEPLNTTCADICRLRTNSPMKPTVFLIAQQLRLPEVFEDWLKSFHRLFHVFRVPDQLLTEPLREGSGFVVHIGILRSPGSCD
ncbi:hypothetical protein BDV96DRAFT_648419 [Lophiotrema nucula]|uniref:Methyltransferase-domain-containing protein n=1 Tax=Lophiotrema nucula TaxID=690887 RepID=A0A6A5Z573_9PLEO|nr:hypothetical protein BDV96DRAFT_648419 [Lophiotrema nucula]